MSNFPHIFLRSRNILLTVPSCGDSLEMSKPSAIFTFLAMFCNFGRNRKPGGLQCGDCNFRAGWGGTLATSESDLYVNLMCELYFCSCERGRLRWYQGKTP